MGRRCGSRKRKRHVYDDEESGFEQRRRPSTWRDDESTQVHLLPVKSSTGWVHRRRPKSDAEKAAEDADVGDMEQLSETEDGGEMARQPVAEAPPSALPQRYADCQRKLAERQEEIETICSAVLRNPEEQVGKLRQLRALCAESDPHLAVAVRRMAISSITAVFKDIIPGYRIRELTDKEKVAKVSKEVQRLRDFEQSLLSSYRNCLAWLEHHIQAATKSDSDAAKQVVTLADGEQLSSEALATLAVLCAQCLGDMLLHLSHFNYRNNLIAALVPRITSKACAGKIAVCCRETVCQLFEEQGATEVTLEVVRSIGQSVKGKPQRVQKEVVETFLSFDVDALSAAQTFNENQASKAERRQQRYEERKKLSRRDRKRRKAAAKLDKELMEAQATESAEKSAKLQTEILKVVFATYFRILKQSPESGLLSCVLEGLAKFAHLINVEFFSDLIAVVGQIIQMPNLTTREVLNCIMTVFSLLSGQGEALAIDPRQFYCHLYTSLLQLASGDGSDVPVALRCLDKMMLKRRQVSVQRVLAFVKRLCTLSLCQATPGNGLALLAQTCTIMQRYSAAQGLLEAETIASGTFQPEVADPEYSHVQSTNLWELALLKDHHQADIRRFAAFLTVGCPTVGARALPVDLSRRRPVSFCEGYEVPSLDHLPPNPKSTKVKALYDDEERILAVRGFSLLAHQATSVAEEFLNNSC